MNGDPQPELTSLPRRPVLRLKDAICSYHYTSELHLLRTTGGFAFNPQACLILSVPTVGGVAVFTLLARRASRHAATASYDRDLTVTGLSRAYKGSERRSAEHIAFAPMVLPEGHASRTALRNVLRTEREQACAVGSPPSSWGADAHRKGCAVRRGYGLAS